MVLEHYKTELELAQYVSKLEAQVKGYKALCERLQAQADEMRSGRESAMPSPDEIHQMAFEEGQPAEDGDGYLFCAEEFDCFVQRVLDACADHAKQLVLPEGWREFITECANTAGGMVNGNRISIRAQELLAASPTTSGDSHD